MKRIRYTLAAVIFLTLVPAALWPQSLPNLALTRLNYTVTKRTVNPQGAMKEQIDAVDKDLNEATRLGKNSEVRRLLAKGMTLLAGNQLSDTLYVKTSLVLRSERVFEIQRIAPLLARQQRHALGQQTPHLAVFSQASGFIKVFIHRINLFFHRALGIHRALGHRVVEPGQRKIRQGLRPESGRNQRQEDDGSKRVTNSFHQVTSVRR